MGREGMELCVCGGRRVRPLPTIITPSCSDSFTRAEQLFPQWDGVGGHAELGAGSAGSRAFPRPATSKVTATPGMGPPPPLPPPRARAAPGGLTLQSLWLGEGSPVLPCQILPASKALPKEVRDGGKVLQPAAVPGSAGSRLSGAGRSQPCGCSCSAPLGFL